EKTSRPLKPSLHSIVPRGTEKPSFGPLTWIRSNAPSRQGATHGQPQVHYSESGFAGNAGGTAFGPGARQGRVRQEGTGGLREGPGHEGPGGTSEGLRGGDRAGQEVGGPRKSPEGGRQGTRL